MEEESHKNTGVLNLIYGSLRSTLNTKYEKDNKYEVKTPTAVSGVRGTDFLVSHEKDQTEITTFDGKVEARKFEDGTVGTESHIIDPGHTLRAEKNQKWEVKKLSDADLKKHLNKSGGDRAQVKKVFEEHKQHHQEKFQRIHEDRKHHMQESHLKDLRNEKVKERVEHNRSRPHERRSR